MIYFIINNMNKKNINNVITTNINWHCYCVTQKDREKLHKHRSIVLWFTGLSGSGKSTLADILEKKLHCKNISTYILDGDNIRYGLCNDLQFSTSDRHENLRRVGEVARLMVDAGVVVLATLISPYRSDRQMVRNMFAYNCFLEIFIDTPLQICEKRDVKGLYKKAKSGKIENFTGLSSLYEKPENPDIYLDGRKTIPELIDQLLHVLTVKIFYTV